MNSEKNFIKDLKLSNLQQKKVKVFSGIQPSGQIHLGNYLGAIRGWVKNQDKKDNIFCIVDLHAITTPQNPIELKKQTEILTTLLFASGLDPNKNTIFIQSHVSAHSEACWILNCITPMGWLERMTQFKDKGENKKTVSTGLLDYPVLMAADILIYDTQEVPVGEDQKQHVELARDIAQRFNNIYGNTFVIPEPIIPNTGARIMGLNDPTVKMSKTFSNIRGHSVGILDSPDEIVKTFKKATTDSGNEIKFSEDPSKAGVNNLLTIFKVITDQNNDQVEKHFSNARGYGDLKTQVAEVVIQEFQPIREKYQMLKNNQEELTQLINNGAEIAQSISSKKLSEIKNKIGFIN